MYNKQLFKSFNKKNFTSADSTGAICERGLRQSNETEEIDTWDVCRVPKFKSHRKWQSYLKLKNSEIVRI